MSELRAGVIGYGYTGQLHLQAWEAAAGARVAAVADTRPEALSIVPDGVRCFTSYDELLAEDLDAVSICLPTALHHRATLDTLAAGKHVLLEKPIATNASDANEMIAAARRARRRLFVGMTHRFYPEVLEAKRIVDDGTIGDVVMIRDCVLEHFGFLDSPRWYLDPDCAGGGTVLTSGVHLVDRVVWFAGEAPDRVLGIASNCFLGQPVEDSGQMFLSFPSGRAAQIMCGLLAEPHPLVCDLEVIGTRGSVLVHTWQGYEVRTRGRSLRKEIYRDEPHRFKVLVGMCAEVEEFCRAIRDDREPSPSAGESARALGIVLAFYRSVRTGGIEKPE